MMRDTHSNQSVNIGQMLSPAAFSLFIYVGCLCVFGFGTADAASFDCSKAILDVEKAICRDKDLSELDDKLEYAYKRVTSKHKNKEMIRAQQRAWLSVIRNRENKFDLKRIYSDRIELLNSQEPLLTNLSGEFECKIDLYKDGSEESSQRSLALAVSEGKIVAFDWWAVLTPKSSDLRAGFHYSTKMRLSDMKYVEAPGYISLQNQHTYKNQESCDVVISKHDSVLQVFTVGCRGAPETSRFYYVFEQNEKSCILAKAIAMY